MVLALFDTVFAVPEYFFLSLRDITVLFRCPVPPSQCVFPLDGPSAAPHIRHAFETANGCSKQHIPQIMRLARPLPSTQTRCSFCALKWHSSHGKANPQQGNLNHRRDWINDTVRRKLMVNAPEIRTVCQIAHASTSAQY